MTKKAFTPHNEVIIDMLKKDREFAVEYLKAALQDADSDADGQAIFLDAIKRIAKAHGVNKIAKAAGLSQENISRVLSPKGNPRLDTLFAVMKVMGIHLTIDSTPLYRS